MPVEEDHQATREALLRFLLEYIGHSTESQKGMYMLNKATLKALHQLGQR